MGYNYGEMKPALIAAIALAFVIHFAPRGQSQKSPAEKRQGSRDEHPTALTSIPPQGKANPQNGPQGNQQTAKAQSPRWYKSPEWVLVIVGIVTAFVIGWQSWATVRAANAARRSIRLQEIAMGQWVDTEKWETDYTFTQDCTEILPVHFRIKNPTKFKITLHRATCWINGRHIVSIHFRKQLLAPDGYAVAEIKYPLNAGQVTAYRRETLKFEIGGVIYFVDAFGREQEQSFGYTCWCHSDKSLFEPVSFVPPSDTENKAENEAP